ncbi:uncharacterized protein EAF02_009508 [Botrytis sinoallii]|uniref:uncharacterized protein n=1 Tax=Botrytis sinoallii TaxID=1463999 RepID=UPI0019023A7F|nr:uncharacterized protein EAF02_009508 [Botrytis sinoallii]KAF7868772.1 hypothetical protein EAF02_009508 [Botrytis sinoallii]
MLYYSTDVLRNSPVLPPSPPYMQDILNYPHLATPLELRSLYSMLEPSYMYIQAQHIPYIHSTSQDKEAAKETAKQQACKHILYPYNTTVTTTSGPITSLYARHTRLCLAILHPQAPVHNMLDPSHRRSSSRSRSGFAYPNPDPKQDQTPNSNIDTNNRYIYIHLSRVINIVLAQPQSALAPDSPRPHNRPILSETSTKKLGH